MAAYDNVSLPAPPNIATAGNYAQMLMQGLQDLPKQYWQGQQQQYEQRQRDLFNDPYNRTLLDTAMKSGDFSPLLSKLIQAGGASTASGLIPSLMSIRAGQDVSGAITGGGQQPPNVGPASSVHASPESITGPQRGGQATSPRMPYTPVNATGDTDTAGGDTVRTLSAGIGGGNRDMPQAIMANLAASLGIGPDDPIPAGQLANAKSRIGNWFSRQGSTQSPAPTAPLAPGGGPQSSGPSGYEHDDNNTNQGTPTGTGGAPQVTPASSTGAGGLQGGRSSFADRFPQPGAPPPGARPVQTVQAETPGVRPTPVGTEAEAREAFEKARNLRAIAARIGGINKGAAEQAGKEADYQFERGKQIMESLGKFNEPGRTTRDVESGATQQEAYIKNDVERFGKQYDKYQTQADEADKLVDTLKLSKSLLDNPGFYSGSGSEYVLGAQRLAVALGLKPENYAMANEVFGKTVSSAILDQIRSLGGQGLGQVRVAEINVMKQAAQNHDNTPASNRLLTELQTRMAETWTKPVAEKATQWNNGHLDAGFDRWKRDYINSHPLLTKDELADPRRIAPPLVRTPADLKKIGWKDGDPFRTPPSADYPNGRILTHLGQ